MTPEQEKQFREEAEGEFPDITLEQAEFIRLLSNPLLVASLYGREIGLQRRAYIRARSKSSAEIEELRAERNLLHKLLLEHIGEADLENMEEFLKFKFHRTQI